MKKKPNLELLDSLMEEARKESDKTNTEKVLQVRLGAVLVSRSGKIISRGHNKLSLNNDLKNLARSLKTRLNFDGYCTVHAEMDCLSKLGFDQKAIKGSTLVLYGVSRAGNILKSRPCRRCIRLVQYMRIPYVVYSVPGGSKVVERIIS